MAIDAYVGLPGSGKSYSVVRHVILPALEAGRTVVTNLPLKMDVIREGFPNADVRAFDTEKFVSYREAFSGAGRDAARRAQLEAEIKAELDLAVPAGCVLVLDEVWRLWPSAGGRKDTPQAFESLLAEHRHRVDSDGNAMAVVLCTQDLAQIASWARALVAMTYRTVNMSFIGARKRYRVDIYQGAVTGNRPSKSQLLRQSTGTYEAKITRYYESHTMRKGGGAGANEKSIDGRGSLWASPLVSIGLPVVVILFGLAMWRVWAFFNPEPEVAPSAGGAPVARPAGPSGATSGALVAGRWRVTGWVLFESEPWRSMAYLSDGSWRVAVPFERFCRRFVEGWVTCEYRGQLASSELQPEAREVLPAALQLPGFLGGTEGT